MPAHKSRNTAGQYKCGNGQPLTVNDIVGNAEADRLAKMAVQQHRADATEVRDWNDRCVSVEATARWVARTTWAANNCEDEPYKDSEASRRRADVHKKQKQKERAGQKLRRAAGQGGKSEILRGHIPQQILQTPGIRSGWSCKTCRKISSKKSLLTKFKCNGDPVLKWSKIESEDQTPLKQVDEHKRMLSGSVLRCRRCGVYADKKAKGVGSHGRSIEKTSHEHSSEDR